jgi:para-nitrobenzyl esterase
VPSVTVSSPKPTPECPWLPERLSEDRVRTTTGVVRGREEDGIVGFKAIPFAAKPVGELRFRPPQVAACWEGELPALTWGLKCPQVSLTGALEGNEDCLTLNVWTPAGKTTAKVPVLFFIHGGSNIAGGASVTVMGREVYNGAALARRTQSVVVTVQYRLGVLGYLAHPALSAQDEHNSSGNYGLLDQIAALRWVQENIEAFGGDPARVLLFGQSAGAFNACALIASPLTSGLFSRAMMLSGGCLASPREKVFVAATRLATALGCGDVDVPACLRAQDANAFLTTSGVPGQPPEQAGFNPHVDGWVLTDTPLATIGAQQHNAVPTIISTTADEFTTMMGSFGSRPVTTDADYHAQLLQQFGSSGGEWLYTHYPAAEYGSPNKAYVAVLSDLHFNCSSRRGALALSRASTPVYRALFTHAFEGGPLKSYGAGHGFDNMFGFGEIQLGAYVPTDGELGLVTEIMDRWGRFAATGDPNAQDATPAWPLYEPVREAHLELNSPLALGAKARAIACDRLEPYL